MTKATYIFAMLLGAFAFAGVLVTAIVALYFGRDLHAQSQLAVHGRTLLEADLGTQDSTRTARVLEPALDVSETAARREPRRSDVRK